MLLSQAFQGNKQHLEPSLAEFHQHFAQSLRGLMRRRLNSSRQYSPVSSSPILEWPSPNPTVGPEVAAEKKTVHGAG